MTEPTASSEKPHMPRDRDGSAAVIASLIGLLALCVSGYTAWLQRQQVRAQVWPYLETGISPSNRHILLVNKGVGPARIRSLQVFVDGKPQRDWRAVYEALGLGARPLPPWSTANGVVLPAGERLQQLAFLDAGEFAAFQAQYPRIQLKVCYCSALNECWLLDERIADPTGQTREVGACPAHGPDEFADNVAALGQRPNAPSPKPAQTAAATR